MVAIKTFISQGRYTDMARTTRAKPIRQVKRGKVESGKHKRSTARDRNLTAKKPGKRVSASGKTYYERRVNRSDVSKKKRL